MPVLFPRLRAAKNFVGRYVRTKLRSIYVRQRLRKTGLSGQMLRPDGFTTVAGLFANTSESTAARPGSKETPERWIIYPASTDDFPLPQTIEGNDVAEFMKFRGYHHPPAFVYRLTNAFYHGDFGAVADARGRVFSDLLDASVESAQPLQTKSEPHFCDGNALVLSSSSNYYHWLIKMLPRLHLMEEARLSPIHFRKLLVNWPHPVHSEAYALARLPAKALQIVKEQDFWVCRNLYVSTIPHHAPSWAIGYLRSTFASELRNAADNPTAIYLIRGNAPWRRVRNEEEVIAHLAKNGIESVDLSRHTFSEQIEIISSAKLIIALHGAALANLIFGMGGARVLEIFASAGNQKIYRAIAAHRGMIYHYFLAQPIPIGSDPNRFDAIIPLHKLDRALDLILAGENFRACNRT